MADRWQRGSRRLAPAASLTVVALLALGPAPSARAQTDDDGLRTEARTRYVVDPEAASVLVTIDLTLTNETPDQVDAGGVRQFYFTSLPLPVFAEAGAVTATSGGRPLRVDRSTSDDPRVAVAVIDLAPDLYYGESQDIRVEYTLPDQPPRSETFTRVNDAFFTFTAFTIGDPGLADVEIVVPNAYEVEDAGDELAWSTGNGVQVLRATTIDDPYSWYAQVSGRDDDHLRPRAFRAGDRRLALEAWPHDPAWATFVETTLLRDLDVLESVVGEAWPLTDRLTIVESASPYIYGYAGWYLPAENRIEVGDALDEAVLLHEVAHVWASDRWFSERWLGEAFAELFATAVITARGGDALAPDPIVDTDPGRVPLESWGDPALGSEAADATEAYGYNASFAVLDAITDEIGADRLRAVIDAIAIGTSAYRTDVEPPPTGGEDRDPGARPAERTGSRRALDLLENVGGSTIAAELFGRHVFAADDAALLASRSASRTAYAALAAAGDDWAPPEIVRRRMGAWAFDEAVGAMTQATEALDARAALAVVTEPAGLDEPATLAERYEGADAVDDLARLVDDIEALGPAARAIEDARAALDRERDVWETVGMWFADGDGQLAAAERAFDDGRPGAARDLAGDAQAVVEGAAAEGRLRVALAALVLLLVAVGAWQHRRARRRRRADAAG